MRASDRTAGGALVCAVLLLAGCSGDGDEDPVTLPSTTASTASAAPTTPPATTPSSDPTPTTTLTLPNQHVASADSFVADFFAALNLAKTSREFASFEAMYLPQCTGCNEYREELQGWLQNGQIVKGGDWRIVQQNSKEVLDGARVSFRVLAYRSAAQVIGTSGEVVREVPGTEMLLGGGGLIKAEPWIIEDMSLSPAPGS